jgi:ADP-dependent phosphofructokinase/glucokinase
MLDSLVGIKMKTTIDILDEIGVADVGAIRSQYVFGIERLEQFRLAVEAEFLKTLETQYCIDGAEMCSDLEDIASEMQEGDTTTLYTWKTTKAKLIEYKKDADGCLYTLPKETK